MNKEYTSIDMGQVFQMLKNLPPTYSIEKVHQFIHSPQAMARQKGTSKFRTLKIILMTMTFLTGALIVFFAMSSPDAPKPVAKQQPASPVETIEVVEPTLNIDNGSKANSHQKSVVQRTPKETIPEVRSTDAAVTADEGNSNNQAAFITPVHTPISAPLVTAKENKETSPCDWPADTVIDKEELLIHLTDEELLKIGIGHKGKALFYHNVYKGDGWKYDMEHSSQKQDLPRDMRQTTYNPYIMKDITNMMYEPNGGPDFYEQMDTLVPVVISYASERIFWFTPHSRFFADLPERYQYLVEVYNQLKCLKQTYPDRSFINYLQQSDETKLDPVNVLHLNRDELQNIGIDLSDRCLCLRSEDNLYKLKFCKSSTTSAGKSNGVREFPPNPYPVFITDTKGRKAYLQAGIGDANPNVIDILVPVELNLHELVEDDKETLIAWYYPTEEFVNGLPAEIRDELGLERDRVLGNTTPAANSETSTSSCTYFEACKSTLEVNDLKLYPNPAADVLHVSFTLQESTKADIALYNIAGQRMKSLQEKQTLQSGVNTYLLDVSDVGSGLYLLTITSDKGFKTQRVVISK